MAHGAEMPDTASGLEYGAGFVIATACLHAFGVGFGLALGLLTERRGQLVTQFAGAGMAGAGIAILSCAI